MHHGNKQILHFILTLLLFGTVPAINSCCPDEDDSGDAGKLKIRFLHTVDGQAVKFDTLIYVNDAGNEYMITDFQYFISDVKLHRGAEVFTIDDWKDIWYVDSFDTTTYTWDVFDPMPPGHYDSLSFILGLTEQKNQNGLFVNPPEVNMFWPDVLGGGYHYLKLNGKWKAQNGMDLPYNFHTGIGREITATDTIFHHLYFRVSLPASSFDIITDSTTALTIQMNIESWFKTPHTWDWDSIGGAIMENWLAMKMATENGYDVFSMRR